MPKKIYKYNSACEAGIHNDKSQVFVLHVARCKVCQEKLPGELLETLEPDLSKLRQSIAKRQAKTGEKAPQAQPVKVEKKVPLKVKPSEPKLKEPVTKPSVVESGEPINLLDAKIRELPSIQGMAKTIGTMKADVGRVLEQIKTQKEGQQEAFKSLGEKIELMLGVGLESAKASEEGGADKSIESPAEEPVGDTQPKIPPTVGPQVVQPGTGGEHITMPSELLKEAEDIRKDQGGDSRPPLETERPVERLAMREGEDKPVQEEETVIPPVQEPGPSPSSGMPGIADLDRPEQIEEAERAMKQYISQQKEKLGMAEGGGAEVPGTGGKIGLLTDAKDIATQVRGIIEAIKGGGGGEEGVSLPKTTEELAGKVLMQVVSGAASKKDPIEYLTQGMKLSNDNLANSIKLFTGLTGKGNLGPSMEDIGAVVRKEIQKMITPTTSEHLTTTETGE